MRFYKTLMLKQLALLSSVLLLSGCVIHTSGYNNSRRVSSFNSNTASSTASSVRRDVSKVNRSVVVGAGERLSDIQTVNGRVTVESGATVENVHTVNGRVVLAEGGSIAGNVDTVNGRILARRGGEIGGSATTVNGRIDLTNVVIGRSVETSNGSIYLSDVAVGANVETRNGDIRLENSVIEQDLVIHRRTRIGFLGLFEWNSNDPEVIIGPGSVIKGNLIARTDIRLYVHESASIGGIVGANAKSYSGRRP